MRALVPLTALLLVAGCSSGSTRAVAPTPTPTPVVTTDAPTPTPAATTEAPSPTPSATPSPTASPTPTGSKFIPAIDGDVDGDGKVDTIKATATLLSITLSGSGRVVTAVVHSDAPTTPKVLGSGDVDRDGRAEVFLQTGTGASTTIATPYRYDGKTLVELQLDGGPARLTIGGDINNGNGFRCLPSGQLELRSATSTDGKAFTVHADDYVISGTQLVLKKSSTGRGAEGSPSVESSYSADCGSVSA